MVGRFAPFSIAGATLVYLGAPAWMWVVILGFGLIRASWKDMHR